MAREQTVRCSRGEVGGGLAGSVAVSPRYAVWHRGDCSAVHAVTYLLHMSSMPRVQVLCECLAYACCIRQRLTTADIADITGEHEHSMSTARP